MNRFVAIWLSPGTLSAGRAPSNACHLWSLWYVYVDGDHDGDDHDDDDGDDGDGDGDHDDDDGGDGDDDHDGHLRGYFTEGADDAEE